MSSQNKVTTERKLQPTNVEESFIARVLRVQSEMAERRSTLQQKEKRRITRKKINGVSKQPSVMKSKTIFDDDAEDEEYMRKIEELIRRDRNNETKKRNQYEKNLYWKSQQYNRALQSQEFTSWHDYTWHKNRCELPS